MAKLIRLRDFAIGRRLIVTISARRLAIAFGIAAAILWIFCSALIALIPGPMMSITGHMFHANMGDIGWTLTLVGFVIGLVAWVVCAAATGWLIGWLYNRVERSNAL